MTLDPWVAWLAIGACVAGVGAIVRGAGPARPGLVPRTARDVLAVAILALAAAPLGALLSTEVAARAAVTAAGGVIARDVLGRVALGFLALPVIVLASIETLRVAEPPAQTAMVLMAAALVLCAELLDLRPDARVWVALVLVAASVTAATVAWLPTLVAAAVFAASVWTRALPLAAAAAALALSMLAFTEVAPERVWSAATVAVLLCIGWLWWRMEVVMDRATFGRPHLRAAVLATLAGAAAAIPTDGVTAAAPLILAAAAMTLFPLLTEDRWN